MHKCNCPTLCPGVQPECGRPAKWRGTGRKSHVLVCDTCKTAGVVLITLEPIPPPAENGCLSIQLTWWQKLGRWLFPIDYVDLPELSRHGVGYGRDGICCTVEIRSRWLDRLRFFLTGRAVIAVKITTENIVGDHRVATGFSVRPPNFLAIERQKL